MQNQDDSNTKHTSSQKMAMAAFIVVLVATCIIYGASLFNHEADEIVEESVVYEEIVPIPPQQQESSPKANKHTPEDDGEVFMIVEQMPELIGGLATIQSKIKYPELAKKAGIEGRVFIQFVVDKNGHVTDPVVVRGIGGGCDEEAVRAVSQAKFKPGKQRNEVVKVKMSLPVTFKLK